jgi:hypothetical protein
VRERLRSQVGKRWRDEIESEALAILVRYFRQQRRVDSLKGLVACTIRSLLVRALRRERQIELRTPEHLDQLEWRRDMAQLQPRVSHGAPRVRGARQKWLIERSLSGASCEQMAAESGIPMKELHRQMNALAQKLHGSERARSHVDRSPKKRD